METLAINVLIGFWLVLFAAMAISPFVLESKEARRTPHELVDDQIISIVPLAEDATPHRPLTPMTTIPNRGPDQRDAA